MICLMDNPWNHKCKEPVTLHHVNGVRSHNPTYLAFSSGLGLAHRPTDRHVMNAKKLPDFFHGV